MERDELLALEEWCEKASGPDRRLDAEIWCAINPPAKLRRVAGDLRIQDRRRDYAADSCSEFTASLDAAMTLVPEGWHVGQLEEDWKEPGWKAQVVQRPSPGQRRAFDAGGTIMLSDERTNAATPALALCAAALRARAQTPPSDTPGEQSG